MGFLKVSSSPHMKHEDTTRIIMAEVLVALCPALIWAFYIYGARALSVTLTSIVSCVFFEFIYRIVAKKNNTTSDLSAAVTGMLLAFSLPVSVPLWMVVLGAFFAIIIVKQLYGGIGKNFLNPALTARVFLFLSFPTEMATYTKPFAKLPVFATPNLKPDVLSGATPLNEIQSGNFANLDKIDLLFGNTAGCIGEVSALLLIIGGVYLLVRKIITWHIPVSFLATVLVISYISGDDPVQFAITNMLSGGLVLGAFFMATDYTTSPVGAKGRIIYGIGCGLITMLIRLLGGYTEGVAFAILIMNALSRSIDKFARPRAFGDISELSKAIERRRTSPSSQELNLSMNSSNTTDDKVLSENAPKFRMRAQVMCSGTNDLAKKKYIYEGVSDCVAAKRLSGGDKLCPNGCIGLGTCAQVCNFDAISIINGVASISYDKCRACGACLNVCPKNLIRLVPEDTPFWVGCMSDDKGAVTHKYCDAGCMGCKLCEKNCESGAIKVTENIAEIDYEKCTGCGKCESVCPRKIIWSGKNKTTIKIEEPIVPVITE